MWYYSDMSNKDFKFSALFTKKLYEATILALEDLKEAKTIEEQHDVFVVWATAVQLMEYSLESFIQISDQDKKIEFIEKMKEGFNNIPEIIEEDDLLKNTPYTKKTLPEA